MHASRFLFSIFLSLVLYACSKETRQDFVEDPDYSNFYICHTNAKWDSLRIAKALPGLWKWERISCYWEQRNPSSFLYLGLTVEFKPDQTLQVRREGELLHSAKWQLRKEGAFRTYSLQTEPMVHYVRGLILFCGNKVEFQESYIDGCDNRFVRLK